MGLQQWKSPQIIIFMQAQYKFNCQNDTIPPNSLKTHKQKPQSMPRLGFITPNLKNTNFQKLNFFFLQKLVVGL